MTRAYLDQLNPQQRQAVEYCDGPQLVIAGAGSGKTRVLTYKIVHLLSQGYEPWRIVALTFTNKAAREMRERIEALVGPETARRLWMGTFHSIFSRILRQNAALIGFKPTFTIYDSADSKALIKQIIKDMNLDDKLYKPSTIQGVISMAKNALISPDAYAADRDLMAADRAARRPLTVDIYRTYRARCRVAGAMDFDDLLYYTNVLLKEHPEVLAFYRDYFRYLLVDEYQDTNFAQHCIVTALSENTGALTMVGDDAQSIYSFRGANIRNILNLQKAYPDLRIFKLEQNYRSTQNIVDAANSLIDKNREQIRKQVFSLNDPGPKIEVINCYTDYEEAGTVAERMARRRREQAGDTWDDFAILYRTNAQSRRLEEALRKRNIPYRIYGGLSFYQRKEIKDAIAYFRLAVNPDDDEALRRIINYPARGIGETTVGKLTRAAIEANVSIWEVLNDPLKYQLSVNSGTARKLAGFRDLVAEFVEANRNDADAAALATMIISRTAMLTSLMTDTTPENMSKQENLQEILTNVREFVDTRTEEGITDISMTDFLAEVSLATDQDDKDSRTEGPKVTMMTVHASKGLEFGNVIIVGVEDELFPSAMSQSSIAEIEEERRLLYVAITRAKRFCMMSYASSRFRNGQSVACRPSPFLRDIDPRYIKLMQGTALAYDRSAERLGRYRESFHSPAGVHSLIDPAPSSPAVPPRPRVTVGPASAGTQPAPQADAGEFSRHTADELADGMEILHERFGRGRIVSIDHDPTGAKINVLFPGADQKKLMLKFARFKILD